VSVGNVTPSCSCLSDDTYFGTRLITCTTQTPTPTKTATPTPTQTIGAIVVPQCSVIYVELNTKNIYSYNKDTNISTLLPIPSSFMTDNPQDIAHTNTKLWVPSGTNLIEYNIQLSPFSATYNRTLTTSPNIYYFGAGLCAIDDTTLISSKNGGSSEVMIRITLNPNNTTTTTNLFSLPSGRIVAGDIIYTTNGKIIVTTLTTQTSPWTFWISQYSFNGTNWVLEFDKVITSQAPYPFGLATIDGGIYIFSETNLKQIGTTFPYSITQVNNIGKDLSGASQVPSCCNVTFITSQS
jgi:hypothetical protein